MSQLAIGHVPPEKPAAGDDDRPAPMTYNRAATAVVQGLQKVNRALEEVRLAVEILSRIEESERRQDPTLDGLSIRRLERVIERLDGVRRDLGSFSRAF